MLQVFGLARVGFCVANLDGVLLSADRTYSEILHYDHIRQGQLSMVDITLPEDVGPLSTIMANVSANGGPLLYRRPAVRADGQIIWVENRLSILHSATERTFLVASREVSGPQPPAHESGLVFSPKTCAAYIADLAAELSVMASDSNLTLTSEMLSFAGEIVQAEAATLETDMHMMAH